MTNHPFVSALHSFTMILLCMAVVFSTASARAELDGDLLKGLKARTLGPAAIGGRISAIDAVASNPNRLVVGAGTGGVWISDNGGLTWTPVFDDEAVASIGALAINQSNPDIIWVGTGESNVRNSTSIGGGVYKSIDGGKKWTLMGLANSERIDRIALHPTNPDIVYVAAMGTLWGPNEERGVYKTIDGGESWDRILYVDEDTGATDIKMDPSNPNKLFAGMWQFRRWPYFFKSGGPGSGLYVSYDAGATWQEKTEEDGLPKGELGRMVFAMSPHNPKRVYALVEADKSAFLVSQDGGEHWTKVNEAYNVADRPFYYTEIYADPNNADRVYNIATNLRESIDGGKNFTQNDVIACCGPGNTVHIDNHAYWINPSDSRHMIIGNDGGLAITRDQGETWRFVRNLPLAQFYHVAVDNENPYNVYGGLQDNGSWRGPAEVWESAGIRNAHWQEIGFGDGFDTRPDPDNARRGYVMSQGGELFRWNLDSGETRMIRPDPQTPDTDLRFNWNAGLAQDPFDDATIYYGSQYLHKSTDRGKTWTVISDDLTSNDPDMQTFRESGGITSDVTAAENYTTIVAVAPSTLERGVLWVGTDDGRVQLTRDGGETWHHVNQRVRGAPNGAWVPMIAPSPHDAGTAFVVFDDHRRSNMKTYVFRVENYGKRWHALSSDDLSGYALSVLQDSVDPDLLFLGTEFGLFFSINAGDRWTKFTAGVPTVSVMDMAIQDRENDLVLGTHGRSIYVIDDYSALRGLNEDDFNTRLKLLSATEGQHYVPSQRRSTRFTGSGEFRGQNESYGVMVTYMASGEDLPHPDDDTERERKIHKRINEVATEEEEEEGEDKKDDAPKITITVKDAEDELIRTFSQPVHQGINRVVWNMRRDGIRGMPGPEKRDYKDGLPAGPEIIPGTYTITISLPHPENDPTEVSQRVTTVTDPRSPYSQAEIEQNYQTLLSVMKLEEALVSAVERIDRARTDAETIIALIDKSSDAEEDEGLKELKKQARKLEKSLDSLEESIRVPAETTGITYRNDKVSNIVGTAHGYVSSTFAAPSPTANTYLDLARTAVDDMIAEVNDFMTDDLAEFRRAVDDSGVGLLTEMAPVSVE